MEIRCTRQTRNALLTCDDRTYHRAIQSVLLRGERPRVLRQPRDGYPAELVGAVVDPRGAARETGLLKGVVGPLVQLAEQEAVAARNAREGRRRCWDLCLLRGRLRCVVRGDLTNLTEIHVPG